MKTILCILALSVVALLAGLELAGFGLAIAALVLVIGDLCQKIGPETACAHDCQQGHACTCRPQPARDRSRY